MVSLPFKAAERVTRCPRCGEMIAQGVVVVRVPDGWAHWQCPPRKAVA